MALLPPTRSIQIHSSAFAWLRRRRSCSSCNLPVVASVAGALRNRDLSSARSPSRGLPTKWARENALTILASAAAVGGGFLFYQSFVAPPFDRGGGEGGRGGGGGDSGGWGWGGEGGGCWYNVFAPSPASAKEEQDGSGDWDPHGRVANIAVPIGKLSDLKRYKISEILFFDRRRSSTRPASEDSLFELVSIQAGGVCTKSMLQKELERLSSFGMFDRVDLVCNPKPDGTLGVTVSFLDARWPAAKSFRCINVGLIPHKMPEKDPDMTRREMLEYYRLLAKEYRKRIDSSRPCLLPVQVEREVEIMFREQGELSPRVLQRARDRIQKWYHDEGYVYAQVTNFGNLHTGEVVSEVLEGDITELSIEFQDRFGYICEGDTDPAVIRRVVPQQLLEGHVYNNEAGKRAITNIRRSISQISRLQMAAATDEKNEGGIVLRMIFTEREPMTAEVSLEWSVIPRDNGPPTLASIQPGGTVSFELKNMNGLNRSLVGYMRTRNLLNPRAYLAFDIEYAHPFIDGVTNPRDRTLRLSCFNTDKLSPVYTRRPALETFGVPPDNPDGPADQGIPLVWIMREGLKANITENYTFQSKFTYGLVLEKILSRDITNTICTHSVRPLATGEYSTDGPPTTLSGTGIDRRLFFQANITRDNTKFVNGAVVGQRDIFQLDQGLGIGSGSPVFNRHQLTSTRFLQLKAVEEGEGRPKPPVLVLHGHYGGCVGDLPTYDAFVLGGPYSVRGYSMGELGVCRNILELAVELRIPVRNTYAYAFAEHGNDLGSSEEVKGNSTHFFHRAGRGSSYGVGVKLGKVRAEYVVDHNSGIGSAFLMFGERF